MTITSLAYEPPVRRDAVARPLDYQLLELAIEQYASGAHLASAETVLRHLFPGLPSDLSKPFTFTQGSSRVTVRLEDGVCFVSVPMIRLPTGGGGIAALRYLLTRINGSGQLHQARLRGDDVHLEVNERVSALHPHKLLEMLRRAPVAADQHDDWMIDQFGVTPLERGHIEPLDDAELGRAEAIWRIHWSEVEELLKEGQRKRSTWFLNEVTSFALQRIRFAVPLAGTVLPRLLEAGSTFNDSDVDAQKRETALARCIKEMKALTTDELRACLGHVEHAISPHTEGTPARLAGYIGPGHYRENIERFRAGGHSIDAAMAMIGTYYYLLATHSWPTEIAADMKSALAATSGMPWRDAATHLLAHADALIERYGEDPSDDEDEGAES
jgi:hypothetical protein